MAAVSIQLRASFAFVERNFNLIKRYWSWEVVWLVYSIAESLSVSFIGLGMGTIAGSGTTAAPVDTDYLVLYLLIGTLVWRFLSQIFFWITDLINIERWEGTIEYTLMAPIHRVTHMAGQTFFAVLYSLIFTGIILIVTTMVFTIDLTRGQPAGRVACLDGRQHLVYWHWDHVFVPAPAFSRTRCADVQCFYCRPAAGFGRLLSHQRSARNPGKAGGFQPRHLCIGRCAPCAVGRRPDP